MSRPARWELSEKQLGYLLIFPALVIILVIAIWPVIRSFWISLHDIRLNDPTKTQVYQSYGMDMERFVSTHPLLIRVLEKERKAAGEPAQQQLASVKEKVIGIKKELEQSSAFAERYKKVDELLYEYKPIPQELKYLTMENEQATRMTRTLDELEAALAAMGDRKLLAKPEESLGLVKALKASFIEPNYIGFTYYKQFLTDKRMWLSLSNTLVFTVISVLIELVLGLWIALLINKQFKGRGLIRAAVLIPWAIPTVISAMMWKFMYDGQNGIVAYLFSLVGIVPDMASLLTTKAGAMFSVIFADVWKTTPFMALLLFAGLQTIPQSLYEAADVDGATKTQQFFRITLPLLKSTILVALLFRTLDAFRVFDLIYVLTGGGPANSTETISIYAYKTMFAQMNFGAGSALSVIVFLCVALISIGYIKILGADLISDGSGK
jgi:multiple sugar transport system permease protein